LHLALDYVPSKSLSDLLTPAVDGNDWASAEEILKRWRAAPVNRYANAEAQVNRLGYELLGKKQLSKAIEVFKLNTVEYPQSSNAFDSLADAYLANGDKADAVRNYKRALDLNPTNESAKESLGKLKTEASGTKP
jgi:D-alanyl-D-alanine-carboxypeptidase/D-alanyl-D-alanine-endopeptidase